MACLDLEDHVTRSIFSLLSLSFALTLLGGCAATCEDACGPFAECSLALEFAAEGTSKETLAATCEVLCEGEWKTTCGDGHGEFVDCLAEMACADTSAATQSLAGCLDKCPAMPQFGD